jgi:hypothetical protein
VYSACKPPITTCPNGPSPQKLRSVEMTQSATTQSPDSQPRQNLAVPMLRRGGDLLREAVKGIPRACADLMTCSAYWIDSSPAVWGIKK